ncbi:MFS transporter [Lichenifustis flavocetrariae]|uniref:MFS transporter n=1 Tax=Lichenifustis flavocetrariae TaxID=2949735 RepID=A0AA41YWG5_9HYPH|nr:MFS transporter [Lichenifustis flavocetrariae]MCW6508422.1 MFS transporter [Lichenifustis flavocetrariae]
MTIISTPAAVRAPPTATRSRARFRILALISVGTMINYLDRTVLGIAAPALRADLGIDAAVMGLVFSAFAWTYAASQIPGGVFLDRFGSKITYFLSITFWSLFTLLQAFSAGLYSLLFFRLGLGVAEAPCFPANSRIVGTWFPQAERATATGTYTVGEYIGLAFFSPVLFWLMATYNWHAMFIVVGVAGLVFAAVWWMGFREPHESLSVNQAELDYIAAGGGLAPKDAARVPFAWANVRRLLGYRQIWGASIGQFAGNATLVFFLTWFPTYLATERHMGWVKVGFFAVLPFIAAAIGVMAGGWVSDRLFRKTGSANIARKSPIIFGLLLASCIVTANYVDSDSAVIAILSLAFFGQGMVGLGWTVISDIAPKPLMGLTGGLFNFASNLAGIVTPLVIGFIVSATGSFVGALAFVGGVATVGALSYVFLLGDIHRIELDTVG